MTQRERLDQILSYNINSTITTVLFYNINTHLLPHIIQHMNLCQRLTCQSDLLLTYHICRAKHHR